MNTNKAILGIFILIALFALGFWYTTNEVTAPTDTPSASSSIPTTTTPSTTPVATLPQTYKDLLILDAPAQDELLTSPLTISGKARGMWYFEASFPVILTNWDGLIIAEGIAQAQSDWMTEEYVPFTVTLTYDSPYKPGDQSFMQRGSLILKKDNPSGLPENDDAFETTVFFSQSQI